MRGRLGRLALGTYAGMVICYLLLPIAVMVIFSFNKPIGRKNYEWNQFSLDAWKDPFRYPEFKEAFITSASSFVQPVVSIDGKSIAAGKPGPVATRLREIYVDFARASST